MFESFSSRANQSAVDKLIQLATGKKDAAPVEEDRPAAEPVQQAEAPVEVSAPVEQPPAAEPTAGAEPEAVEARVEAPLEMPAEPAPSAESEAPVEKRPQVADLIRNLAAPPKPAGDELVDGRPFYEISPDRAEEAASAPAEEPARAEPVSEPVVEAAPTPVEESVAAEPVAAEPAPEPVQAAEPPVDERPFFEPPAEPAVEAASAAVEEPVAAEAQEPVEASAPVEFPAPEEAPAPVEAQAEPASEPVAAAEEVKAAEAPAQPVVEKAAEAEAAASEGAEPKAGAKEDEPFNLEKFRQRQAERRRSRGADIFPSADETTFLRSRLRDSQRDEVTEEELKTLSRDPMWKTLVQFKGWLPVVTRVLPLLDLAGKRASSGNSEEIKDSVEGLLVSNRDMRTTLQNQTVELKRVEEEISRLRETSDKNAFEQNALSDDVRGIQRLMKNAFLYLGILLGLLVVAVGYMAFLVFTYLNHPMH